MKVYSQAAFRLVVVIFAVGAIMIAPEFPPGSASEAKQNANPQRRVEYARTMPVSNKMITAKITVDDHDYSTEYSQYEGGLIRIEKIGKAIYGFIPRISGPANQTVTIKVYRISQADDASGVISESLNEVYSIVADKAGKYVTSYADADGSFKIEVLDIRAASRGAGDDVDLNSLGQCCLECRGEVSCSCKISTPCGGCCGGGCCNNVN